jgi:hypothetical protein
MNTVCLDISPGILSNVTRQYWVDINGQNEQFWEVINFLGNYQYAE